MEQLPTKSFFTLDVDQYKNRLNIVLKSFWSQNIFKMYVDSFLDSLKNLRSGFSVLVDTRGLKPLGQKMLREKESLLSELVNRGMVRFAEVRSDDYVTQMQMNYLVARNSFKCEMFTSVELAEQWLDGGTTNTNINTRRVFIETGRKNLRHTGQNDDDFFVF